MIVCLAPCVVQPEGHGGGNRAILRSGVRSPLFQDEKHRRPTFGGSKRQYG